MIWSVGPSVGAQPKLAASYRLYLIITEYRKLALARPSELGFYCCICDKEPTFFFLPTFSFVKLGYLMSALLCARLTKVLSPWLGTYGVCVETSSSHRRRGHQGCLCAQYLSPCHSWDEGTHSCRWTASLTRVCTCTHIATSAVIRVTCDSSQSMFSHAFPYPGVHMCVLVQALFHPHASKSTFAYILTGQEVLPGSWPPSLLPPSASPQQTHSHL